MKKFKYAIGIAAMALFGACSSDAPEIIDNTDEGVNDARMYLSLKISGVSGTRGDQTGAQTDKDINEVENSIKNLLIQIYDYNENLVLSQKTEIFDDSKTTAYFEIESNKFKDIQNLYNATKDDDPRSPRIIVVANTPETYGLGDPVLHDDYNDATWGIASDGGVNTISGNPCFMMSNMAECHTIIGPAANHDGSSQDKAWELNANALEIGRMATRFEYGTDNKNSYDLESDDRMSMTIYGMSIDTHGESSLYIPTFTNNGKLPTDFTSSNHKHYSGDASFPYRATAVVTSSKRAEYGNLNYKFLNKTNKFTYAHPNTISKDYTLLNSVEDFRALPYAAIRVQFECSNFAGTGSASVSMQKGDNVYAVGGVFIGGVKDFIALKKATKTFVVSTDYDEDSNEYTAIKAVVDRYNSLNFSLMPSQNDGKEEGGADDDKWFKGQFTGIDTYAPEYEAGESKETTAEGNFKYYTYYAKYITHYPDPTSSDVKPWMKNDGKMLPQWAYGVSRNTTYALAVKSIKFMGSPKGGSVGDGPKESDFSTLWIDLTITVKDWDLNLSNIDWEL